MRDRVELARVAGGVRAVVAAPRELQRRRRVPEQVVGHAQAGRYVVPVRQLVAFVHAEVRHEAVLGVFGRAVAPPVDLVAHAEVERQPVDGPRVLGEDAHVLLVVHRPPDRRVRHPHLVRHAVPVVLLPEIGVHVVGAVVDAPTVHHADLHVVRAGDVGHRDVVVEALGRLVDVAPVAAVAEVGVGVVAAHDLVPRVHRRARLQVDGGRVSNVVARRARAERHAAAGTRLPELPRRAVRRRVLPLLVAPVLDVRRIARLEQQPAADGRRPLGRPRVVDGRALVVGRRGRVVAGAVRPEAVLEDPVHVGGELVRRVRLVRQAQQAAGDGVGVDAGQQLAPVLAVELHRTRIEIARPSAVHVAVEAAGDRLVHLPAARAHEEPELVAHDRPAVGGVQVPEQGVALGRRGAAGDLRRDARVVGGQRVARVPRVELPAERVAALARDHVDAHPAPRGLGGHAAGLVGHLLGGQLVVVVLDAAVAVGAVDELPVHRHADLPPAHPVSHHDGLLRRRGQADLGAIQLDADNELRGRLHVATGRDGVEHLGVEHLDPAGRLHVDDGRLARDGHRLLERADRKLRVHRGGEAGRQILALDQDGREAGQGEREGVHPGPQVDQRVAAGAVRDGDAAALDEGRRRGLDGDAGQDAARVVGDLPGDGAVGLGQRRAGRQGQSRQRDDCRA